MIDPNRGAVDDPPRSRGVIVVCPVLPYPPIGGGHKRTLRLLEAIDRAGGVPHILTNDPGRAGAADELRSRGWVVDIIEEPPQRLLARIRQHLERRPSPILPRVRARLAELAPHAAFVQFDTPLTAYYWEGLSGRRVVLSTHNVDSELLGSVARGMPLLSLARLRFLNRSLAMRSVERRAARRSDAVLCVSDHDQRYFERFSNMVLNVPNGVDSELFDIDPTLPESEDLVFIGQFDYQPNETGVLRFLREGWPIVSEARPRARLLLAGKGMHGVLEREVRAAERVEALGLVGDVGELLARSRLVISPLWQGGGTHIKVLEGMAAARPVVITPLSAHGLGFENGLHGMMGSTPSELGNLAVELLGDRGRSEELARAGRELADSYRWERTTAPAESLFREWLTNPPGAEAPSSFRTSATA